MTPLIELMAAFFEDEKWASPRDVQASSLRTVFKGDSASWPCVGYADEAERNFVFYSICPQQAARQHYAAVAELLTRLNYSLPYGNFEMGYLDGEVRFRTSLETPDVDPSRLSIDRLIYNNIATMNLYLPAVIVVAENGVPPLDAIADALLV